MEQSKEEDLLVGRLSYLETKVKNLEEKAESLSYLKLKTKRLETAKEIKYMTGVKLGKVKKELIDRDYISVPIYLSVAFLILFVFQTIFTFALGAKVEEYEYLSTIFVIFVALTVVQRMGEHIDKFYSKNIYSKINAFYPTDVDAFMGVKKLIAEEAELLVVCEAAYKMAEIEIKHADSDTLVHPDNAKEV